MINANELREDNLLYDAVGNIGRVVIGLGKFEVATKGRGFVSLQESAPIPLTPEILNSITIQPPYDFEFDMGEIYFCKNERKLRPIRYVHELQNLYFALTDEELNIEL